MIREMPDFEAGNHWGYWGCLVGLVFLIWPGLIILAGLILIILDLTGYTDRKRKTAMQAWAKTKAMAEVPIVGHYHQPAATFEINEYGETRSFRPRYELSIVLPDQRTVEARVSEDVYKKLEDRDTVRIYYERDAPLMFLLEEEL